MLHYTEAIGLDIGNHAAKAVHVRRRWGRVSIEASTWVRLPLNAADRQRVLGSFVTKNGWHGLPCVVAPPMDGMMLQSIHVQRQDPRPVSSIVDLEMSQLAGLAADTTIQDYVVSRDAEDKRILLAVGRVDGVQAAIDLAIASGLRPVQVTPQATALFNVVARRWRGSRRSTFVVIDVGHHCTSVIVGSRSKLIDARHISLGGESLGEGVQSIGSTEGSQNAAEQEHWLEALVSCLSLCEGFGRVGETPEESIILCGGGAQIKGLREMLARRLEKPVLLLGDLGRTSHVENVERMALATGLAMAGMGIGRVQLTLLPATTREAITLHSQANYWIGSGAALTTALLVLLAGAGIELHRKQGHLSKARDTLATITALETKHAALQKQSTLVEAQVAPFAALVHNGDILRTAIGAISRAKSKPDWLTRIADADTYVNGTDTIPEGISPFDQLVIEGYTPTADLSSVSSMIEALRNSPGILDADLLGDDALRGIAPNERNWPREDCERFAIGLTLPTP